MRMNVPMRRLRVICLLPLLLGFNSCTYLVGKAARAGMFDKTLEKTKPKGEAKLIGTIELVNPEQNYVLINCDQRLNLPAGTDIVSHGADGTNSKLKVTPERKGNYITADITEGTPHVQDLVLYRLPSSGEVADHAAAGASLPPLEGPPVHLTPVMQADVIPPLDTPFQPMPAVQMNVPSPAPMRLPPPPQPQEPAQPPQVEFDPSKLPPVVR